LASGLASLAAAGVFGASIAAAGPTFGVSLVIGAIAGAALGAGAGALGKGDTGLNAGRVQQRLAIGNRVYDEIGAAINGALSIEQAARVKIHTGNTVGGLMLQISARNASGGYAGTSIQWAPIPAAGELAAILLALGYNAEQFSEGGGGGKGGVGSDLELIATWGGEGKPVQGGERAEELVRAMLAIEEGFAEALEQAAQQTPFSFAEVGTVGGLGRFRQQTFLPVSRAGEAAGRDLNVSMDYFRNLPPAIAAALWARLVEVDRDMALGIIDRRRFSGEI
jgi:hypothetical protein